MKFFQINTMLYNFIYYSPIFLLLWLKRTYVTTRRKQEPHHCSIYIQRSQSCESVTCSNNGVGYAGDIRAKHTLVLPPCSVSPARTKSSTLHLTSRCQNWVPGPGVTRRFQFRPSRRFGRGQVYDDTLLCWQSRKYRFTFVVYFRYQPKVIRRNWVCKG